MPVARVDGVEFAYELHGRGFPIVFSHGLLMDRRIFAHQMSELSKQFQTMGVDTHGHGETKMPDAEVTLDSMAGDFVKWLDQFRYGRFVFVGFSMGGMIGLRIALQAPRLLAGLVLMDTSADVENPGRKYQYEQLLQAVAEVGITPQIADLVLSFLFSDRFLKTQPKQSQHFKELIMRRDLKSGLRVTRAVIDRLSLLDQISAVRTPTLILVGAEDQTQPWEEAEKIRARLMGAKLVTVPEAGQISSVEQPEFVTRQIAQFMEELNIH